MIELAQRLVSFTFGAAPGTRVWLTPTSGTWKLGGGLTPDINTFTCVYTEFEKLPSNLRGLEGQIELWSSVQAVPPPVPAPDVVLKRQTLVDVKKSRQGNVAGEAQTRVIEYELGFADHRHAWVEPRGGRMTFGQINTLGPGLPNANLAGACLQAMGAVGVIAPSTMNAVAPALDLDWSFAHAPSELARILEHTGHVYCPSPAGFGTIAKANNGALPTWPVEQVVHDLVFSSIDRRPDEVIITSSPRKAIVTWDDAAGAGAPAWQFVAQDPDAQDQWRPLAAIAQLAGDPLTALRDGLPDAEDESRQRLLSQLYRCIQIDQLRYPASQCSLLSAIYSSARSTKVSIFLNVAQQGQDGAWVNVDKRLEASQVLSEEGVLVFAERLVQVEDDENGDLEPFTKVIPEAQLKPTYSLEDTRVYGVWGFTFEDGDPELMSDVEAFERLAGYWPGAAIFSYPDLTPVAVNGAGLGPALAAKALEYARAYADSVTDTTREVALRGFHSFPLSGRVSHVSYDLANVTTTLTIDAWAVPGMQSGGPPAPTTLGSERGDTSLTHPWAKLTRAASFDYARHGTRDGAFNFRKPVASNRREPKTTTGFRPAIFKVGAPPSLPGGTPDPAAPQGVYDADVLSGRLQLPAAGLTTADLGTFATRKVKLLIASDVGASSSQDPSVKEGDTVVGFLASVDDGTLLALAQGLRDPGSIKDMRFIPDPGNPLNKLLQFTRRASPETDDDWTTVVTFTHCAGT